MNFSPEATQGWPETNLLGRCGFLGLSLFLVNVHKMKLKCTERSFDIGFNLVNRSFLGWDMCTVRWD